MQRSSYIYGKLNFPEVGEVSLQEVVQTTGIPRPTLSRYLSRYPRFLPTHVRKPPQDAPLKRGQRRILFFEPGTVDVLSLIRDLSRRQVPHDEVRGILEQAKGGIIAVRVSDKIAPLIKGLQRRENSLPELGELPKDFDYAPLAEGVAVLETEFGVLFPVDVKKIGEDKYEKIVFLINVLFQFHLQENLDGSDLEIRIRDYFHGVHVTTAQEKKLRDWLGDRLGLSGRWSKKNRFVVDQLTYELVQHGGMSFALVRQLFEMCARRIMVSHLVSVPEIKKSWLILLEVVFQRRKLVVRTGVTDVVIDGIAREWRKQFEEWKNAQNI